MKDKKNQTEENQTLYMPICMCLGMSLGTAIGVSTDNLSTFMCFGVSFGLAIGSLIDTINQSKRKDINNHQFEECENTSLDDRS